MLNQYAVGHSHVTSPTSGLQILEECQAVSVRSAEPQRRARQAFGTRNGISGKRFLQIQLRPLSAPYPAGIESMEFREELNRFTRMRIKHQFQDQRCQYGTVSQKFLSSPSEGGLNRELGEQTNKRTADFRSSFRQIPLHQQRLLVGR